MKKATFVQKINALMDEAFSDGEFDDPNRLFSSYWEELAGHVDEVADVEDEKDAVAQER